MNVDEVLYGSGLSPEEEKKIQEQAVAENNALQQEAKNNSIANTMEETTNPQSQTGAMGNQIAPDTQGSDQAPDNLQGTKFAGSMDPESYNFRMTNKEDGTSFLRENAGPDGEKEIIGPTAEPGRYEPGGYVPGSIGDLAKDTPFKGLIDASQGVAYGLHDWFTSEINSKAHIWGYDEIDRAPNANTQVMDATRDITALLAPIIAYTRGAKGAGGAIHKSGVAPARLQALGNDPAFRMLANLGIDIGVGVHVDTTSYQQGEDHNLFGNLKENWPETFKAVPNWLATSDQDSEDTKRHKNRLEGAGLNVATELLGSMARLGKAAMGSWRATRWIPKDEKATKFFGNMAEQYKETALQNSLEVTGKAAEMRQTNLDDIGAYYLSKLDGEVNEPIKGVHDMWDWTATGMRSVDDGGVAGAAADVARIGQSAGTQYGRVGNFISSVAAKYGIDEGADWLISKATQELKDAGAFDILLDDGTKFTHDQIDRAVTSMAELMSNSQASPGFLREVVKELAPEGGKLTDAAELALDKSVASYMGKVYDIKAMQAKALTETSMTGQVVDNAETLLENMGTEVGDQVTEELYDRLEILLNTRAMSNWEQAETAVNKDILRRLKQFVKGGDSQAVKDHFKNEAEAYNIKLKTVQGNTKTFVQTLRNIAKERPDFLKPMYEIYDATNGKVNTMYGLNKMFQAEVGDLTKAFWNNEPEMPSRLVNAGFSNVMNSILSGFGTPISAVVGNFGGLSQKAVGMIGIPGLKGIFTGDWYQFQRGMAAWGSFNDTWAKSMQYGKETMWKLTTQPEMNTNLLNPDLAEVAVQQSDRMQAFRSLAEAYAARGNDGPLMMLTQVEQMEAMGRHPVMRGSGNVMSSQDAFLGAFIANIQARADAFDTVNGKLTIPELLYKDYDQDALFEEAYKASYTKMFDEDGILTDDVAKFMRGEIALNNKMQGGLDLTAITETVPIARTIFMFPNTQNNMLSMFGVKYNPATPLLGEFVDTIQNFAFKRLEDITPDEMIQALTNRGITNIAPDKVLPTFVQLRDEAMGRWAMGTVGATAGALAVMNGRLTGDGHFDSEVQRAREATPGAWPGKRMFKVPVVEKWISYDEILGPMSGWIAAVANGVDNWQTLGEAGTEKFLQKASFIMASTLSDKTMMDNFRTVLDIMDGNEGAINRFMAGQINGFIPGAGQRGEWSKLFGPYQAILDRDVAGYVRNRNSFGDAVVPPGAKLAARGDWLYGGPLDQSWMARAVNAYSPIKIGMTDKPEGRFISIMEFNPLPSLATDPVTGVPLTVDEQAEILEMIGQDGIFLEGVKQVMKYADKTGALEQLNEMRKQGYTNDETNITEWQNIHFMLNGHMQQAVTAARARLTTLDRIETEAYIQNTNDYRAQQGQRPLADRTKNFLRNMKIQ